MKEDVLITRRFIDSFVVWLYIEVRETSPRHHIREGLFQFIER